MLILQIALGIFLGYLLIRYFPQILKLSLSLLVLGIFLIVCLVAFAWVGDNWKNIVSYAVIPFVFICATVGGFGLAYLIKPLIYKVSKDQNTKTRWDNFKFEKPLHAIGVLCGLNLFVAIALSDALPIGKDAYEWGFENGFEDALAVGVAGLFCLWPCLLVPIKYFVLRAPETRERAVKFSIHIIKNIMIGLSYLVIWTVGFGLSSLLGFGFFGFTDFGSAIVFIGSVAWTMAMAFFVNKRKKKAEVFNVLDGNFNEG